MNAEGRGESPWDPILLRLLLDQVPAIVWTTDEDLRLTTCVGAGLHPLHVESSQLVGKTLFEHLHTEDVNYPPIAAHLQALQGQSATYELAVEGRKYECHVEPLVGEEGTVGVVGVALDVTQQKHAEQKLHECEELLRSLAGSSTAESARPRSIRKDSGTQPAGPRPVLTVREREVLRLTVEGHSGNEIAQQLFISPRTVESHRANLMRKLGVRNQKELVRCALVWGIVPEEDQPRTLP